MGSITQNRKKSGDKYINAFEYGSFDNYVKVVNFFHKDGIDEYFQESLDNEEIMTDLKEMQDSFGMKDVIIKIENGIVVSRNC